MGDTKKHGIAVQEAMPGIVLALEKHLPEKARAFELFVRDGSSVTIAYAHLVEAIFGYDINEEYLLKFADNFPGKAIPFRRNSIDAMKDVGKLKKKHPLAGTFDLVVVDNPQGIYGKGYTEHFNLLEAVHYPLKPQSFILLCVNLCPYRPTGKEVTLDSYGMESDQFDEWIERRREFYGVHDADDLPAAWMIRFYRDFFATQGYPVEFSGLHIRKSSIAGHKNHIAYFLFRGR
jgi:hypothetical protein